MRRKKLHKGENVMNEKIKKFIKRNLREIGALSSAGVIVISLYNLIKYQEPTSIISFLVGWFLFFTIVLIT